MNMDVLSAIIGFVALIILALYVIYCAKKGFAKSFIQYFSWLLGLVFALLLVSTVVNFLEETYSTVKIFSKTIGGWLDGAFGKDLMDLDVELVNNQSVNGSMSTWLIGIVVNAVASGSVEPGVAVRDVISPVFSYYIISFITFIILYILFRIILYIIAKNIDKFVKLKLVRRSDIILGAALGLVKGFITLSAIITIINIIPWSVTQTISIGIAYNPITSFVSSINIFQILLNYMPAITYFAK